MPPRIFAVVTVYDTPQLLPFFVEHYERLGVDRIIVVSCVAGSELPISSSDTVVIKPVRHDEPFTNQKREVGEQAALDEEGANPDDWVLHLDLDEFHQYPCHLRDLASIMEQQHIHAITGFLYDRLTEDGTLKEIAASPHLWQQFPVGGWVLSNAIVGYTQKIMIARRHIFLSNGRHFAPGIVTDNYPVGVPKDYLVHHFRWNSGCINRLEQRFATLPENDRPRMEYGQRTLAFCKRLREDGRVAVEDPRFQISSVADLTYPNRSPVLAALARLPWDYPRSDNKHLVALTRIVREQSIKSVLEFGPGRATFVFSFLGCEVDSLEFRPDFTNIRKMQFSGVPGVSLQAHDRPITNCVRERYDLAFVNGPPSSLYDGSLSRLDAVLFGLQRTETVILHDSHRSGERDTIQYCRERGCAVEEIDTPRGLAILQRAEFVP